MAGVKCLTAGLASAGGHRRSRWPHVAPAVCVTIVDVRHQQTNTDSFLYQPTNLNDPAPPQIVAAAHMAPPLGILDLHAKLRTELGLDAPPQAPADGADAFAAATQAITGESEDLDASLQLHIFLNGVTSRNSDLKSQIRNMSLDTLTRLSDTNGKVTHAWANLLCLGHRLSTDTVLSAVKNIFSAAAPEEPRAQQAEQATGPGSKAFSPSANQPVTPGKRPLIVEDDTPIRANSALPYSAKAKFRAHVDPFLRAELRGTVLKDVKGFYKFFPGITETQWACAVNCPASCACPDTALPASCACPDTALPASCSCADTAFPARRSGDLPRHIPPFPKDTSQVSVLKWFIYVNKPQSSRTFYTSHNRPLTGSQSDSARKCDLFLAPTNPGIEVLTTNADAEHPWPAVLIPAELKASPTEDATAATIIQLATYVREVFGSQLTRRFVHAFTICGSVLRCYLFDRAGVSISQKIDIRKNNRTQELWIKILQGYVSMNPTQLGFDENYEYIGTNNTISSMPSLEAPRPQSYKFNGRRFKLRAPVFHRSVIVSRGTTCWEAEEVGTGEVCIIKDAWRASWRTSEGDLLALASNRGVFALPAPIEHGDVLVQYRGQMVTDTIVKVRECLKYDDATQVVIKLKQEDDLYSLGSSLPVIPVSIGTSNKQVSVTDARKPLSDITREPTRKRSLQTAMTSEQGSEGPRKKGRTVPRTRNNRGGASERSKISYSATSLPSIPELIIAPRTNVWETTNDGHRAHTSHREALFQSPVGDTETGEHEWTLAVPTKSTAKSRVEVRSTGYTAVVSPLCTQAKYMDMTHSLIVSNSVGEDIKNFTCVNDLLMGMRDAIKCKYVI